MLAISTIALHNFHPIIAMVNLLNR